MMLEKLIQDKKLLEKQLFWVNISFDECSTIGIKKEYSVDEFGRFETLCSRYSRGIDFLIRKIFRTLDEYEFENQGTLVDVAELYGVETKRVNEAVSNNLDKFPKDEKFKLVEHFDHLSPIKYSPYLPKAFTKKGLWMLATILSSKQAKETTFLIIETFDKVDNLKYNLKKVVR
jgi:hypothetical protein